MSRQPLPRQHISSLGGYARARKLGTEGLAEHSRNVQESLRARLGESAYRERMKRLALRRRGYDIEVR